LGLEFIPTGISIPTTPPSLKTGETNPPVPSQTLPLVIDGNTVDHVIRQAGIGGVIDRPVAASNLTNP